MLKQFALLLALLALPALASAGDTWKHYEAVTAKAGGPGGPGLPSNELQFIKCDPLGTLWIGTGAGLVKFAEGKFEKTPVAGQVWDICRIDEKQYWVGTGSGAVLVKGDKAETMLTKATVAPIVPFQKGTFLALSKDRATEISSLVEYNGSAWEPVASLKDRRTVDMLRMADGKIWVSLDGDGLAIFDPAKGSANPTRELASQNVTAVMQDSKGKIWCGLWQRGLSVFDGKSWTNHLADKKIYAMSIREDKAGVIWVATDQAGLWKFDGKSWTNDLKDEGPISLLETTSDGKVWISSQSAGGLKYWDGKTWIVSLEGPTPIRCLYESPTKQLFAGAVLDGLYVK